MAIQGFGVSVTSNSPDVIALVNKLKANQPSILREAMNRAVDAAKIEVKKELVAAFDRPTPFTVNSLRVTYASTANLRATLWFRQRSREDDKQWAVAQILGGQRQLKPMELRLRRSFILPVGWMVVPGGGADIDAYGNISGGQVSQLLNVLGTYTEAGYNKANAKTVQRLKRGTKKSYGFEYLVNYVDGPRRIKHLLPGVYKRYKTPFGSSLKPILIFVSSTKYKRLLRFEEVITQTIKTRMPYELDKAISAYKLTGSASANRKYF